MMLVPSATDFTPFPPADFEEGPKDSKPLGVFCRPRRGRDALRERGRGLLEDSLLSVCVETVLLAAFSFFILAERAAAFSFFFFIARVMATLR